MRRFAVAILMLGLLALPALAQNPTGTLSGRATDGNEPLPGVTVSVTSPQMQGIRNAVTEISGDYLFRYLPPGEYRVKFELSGFQTLETTVKVLAAQTVPLNAVMPLAGVAEELTVVGNYETISQSQQVATTYESKLIETLPVLRTVLGAVALVPGVSNTGPDGNLTISGAQSYENLYMVNGVVITDNIRGTPNNLFIEDAIQETTTSTGAVSAEYGRFAGGVVNTLTKSGGNDFSGSYRLSLTNAKWTARTPQSVEQVDKINNVHELTAGGYLLRDKLWFFVAGRYRKVSNTAQTFSTDLPYQAGTEETRYEGKLTYALTPNHRVIGSYLGVEQTQTNVAFGTILDLATLDPSRKLPQQLIAANYSGVLSNNFFVEGQFSRRRFSFEGSGSDYTDLILGTQIRDNVNYWSSNSASFCGVCDNARRDNEEYLAKGSYFVGTSKLGAHDVVFGLDSFHDKRKENNYQTGSNYVYWPTEYLTNDAGDFVLDPLLHQPIPVVYGGDTNSSDFTLWAVLRPSKGSDFRTDSLFANDKWRINNNLTITVGARYDKNNGKDSNGQVVAKDSRLSPRLGVSWDVMGDGSWVANASFGHYVTAIAGSVADQGGGSPSSIGYFYGGPDYNTTGCTSMDPGACLNAHQILERVFAWLFANGRTSWGGAIGRDIGYGRISGVSQIVGSDLTSPYSQEYTAGLSTRLGSRGIVRLDYIHRDFKDLYATRVDMTTGQVTDDIIHNTDDIKIISNSDTTKRTYDGISLQASYRLSDRFDLGGNYTWSRAWGNFDGETQNAGPISNTAGPEYYPEYQQQRWANPEGYLAIDQTHRGRIFAVWNAIQTRHNALSLSLMESYFSGTPYEAIGTIRLYDYVTNPGYANPPTQTNYYFSRRGAYRTDDITRTDLAVNYSFKMPALGTDLEFFVQPQVTNLFNEQGVVNVDTTVYTRYSRPTSFARLNPFTGEPRECPAGTTCNAADGYHWQKGPNFGQPTDATDYQAGRTFRVSFGVRF